MKLRIDIDKANKFTNSVDYELLIGNHKLINLDIWINYIQIYTR